MLLLGIGLAGLAGASARRRSKRVRKEEIINSLSIPSHIIKTLNLASNIWREYTLIKAICRLGGWGCLEKKISYFKIIKSYKCAFIKSIIIILLTCADVQALDLTGTWTGTCFNKDHQMQGNIEADLIQKGSSITGYLKVSKPLYGSGPLKGWINIEKRKFVATIKCNQLIMKIFTGGQTTYLGNAAVDIKEDLGTGQMLGEIKGDYRCDFGWRADKVGTFRLTRTMQEGFGTSATVEEPVYATHYSNIYHKAGCPELETEDLVQFDSPQHARDSGGVPCESCKP